MSNIIKLELPIISVLEKDPVGSKVLERYVFASTSEIKAEQEQSDHEIIFLLRLYKCQQIFSLFLGVLYI